MSASPPSPGLSTEEIRELQGTLKDIGFDPGPPTGRLEDRTRRAISEFQAKNRLPADGIPGPQTLAALQRAKVEADGRKSMPVDQKRSARRPVEKLAESAEPAPARPEDAPPPEPEAPARPKITLISRSSDTEAVQRLTTLLLQHADLVAPDAADAVLVFISHASIEPPLEHEPAGRLVLELAASGSTKLIPVVVEPVDWSQSPFYRFQAAAGARPLTEMDDVSPVVDELLTILSGRDGFTRSYLPRFTADNMEGRELLGRRERIEFLASVLAAGQLETPLAVGLFGDWGSGKSFFMSRLQERIVALTEASAGAAAEGLPSLYCSRIRQVTFNAWLYADTEIWPAFAAQVFRGVTGLDTEAPQGRAQEAALLEYQDDVRAALAAAEEDAAREDRIRAAEAQIGERRKQLAGAAADVGGPAGRLVAGSREIGTRLLGLRSGWRDLRAADVLVLVAVGLAAAGLAVYPSAGVWIGAGVAAALAVLRYVDDARRLRRELRQLEQEVAVERAALADSSGNGRRGPELPLLPEFAAQQAAEWSNRTRLGIVTEIRMRFERLSKMISEANAARERYGEGAAALPIQRVIVYVDDLDRCQHDVVVRVLETLKLLVSLPHFIVVVGVDSRWLFRSLELHFRELLQPAGAGNPDVAWAATPQNYLEKVFQYSVVLRPIGVAGFRNLIESLVAPPAEPAAAVQGLPDATTAAPPTSTHDAPVVVAAPTEPAADLDLTPDELVITRPEIEFMKGLAPLFETPRAAKRLANVYRLLRVSIGADRLVRAEAYEPVLLLLAIGIGFPGLAGEVFDSIARNPAMPWPVFVAGLEPTGDDRDQPEHAVRRKLAKALRQASPEAVADRGLGSFGEWISVVAEFSFHPWQELLPSETQA